jgi:dienelactone hydrolase
MNAAPVIFYYGGDPDTTFFRYITDSKGAIILGMSYANEPRPPITKGAYTNYIKGEVRMLGSLTKYLQKDLGLRIDESRLIITGRSRGGWLTNDIFEYRPQPWAGAAIVSAGRRATTKPASIAEFKGKPVYIGAGEFDPNMKAAKRSRAFLLRAGADVTFEMYEGFGHKMDTESAVFRQWIKDRITPSESNDLAAK